VRSLMAVLSAACFIAMLVLLWKSPGTLNRISDAILGQTVSQASAPVVQPEEKPVEKPAPKKPSKSVSGPPRPQISDLNTVVVVIPKEAEPVTDRGHANVKTDSAAVYSSNSPRSPVVRLLKKGDTVETNLEVIDSGGTWSLVRTGESQRAGFVRSENLDHAKMAASKN
jgi:hypothetical protein